MHPVNPGLDGPTLEQPQPPGIPPLLYQLGSNADGRVAAITRWEITPAERAAIARGEDLFMVTYLDDRPLPGTSLHVGSPLEGQGTAPGELPHVEHREGERIVYTDEDDETPTDEVDFRGGALDGEVMSAADALRAWIKGRAVGYTPMLVTDYRRDPPVEHFRFMNDDAMRAECVDVENIVDEDDDEGEGWKHGAEPRPEWSDLDDGAED
jgi:hypothetical protein